MTPPHSLQLHQTSFYAVGFAVNTYVVKRYKFMKQTTTILYYNNITALFKNYIKLSRTVIMYLRLMQFRTETKH